MEKFNHALLSQKRNEIRAKLHTLEKYFPMLNSDIERVMYQAEIYDLKKQEREITKRIVYQRSAYNGSINKSEI